MPEPEFIVVGIVLGTRGSKGQLKVQVLSDFPQRFAPGAIIYIDRQPVTVEGISWHKGNAILKLQTVNSISDAEKLRGKSLEIHHSQLPSLPEGQYYYFQLIGLDVWTTGGELLGKITGILTTGSNDNYVVSSDKGDILIPAIADVVKEIDLERQRVVVEPITGLLAD